MSLSAILFLFLVHLGIGITLVLAWVGREAGVKFFRFNAGTAVLLIAIGFALRPEPEDPTTLYRRLIGSLVVAEAALVIYWGTIGRMLAAIRPALSVDGRRLRPPHRHPAGLRYLARCARVDAAA